MQFNVLLASLFIAFTTSLAHAGDDLASIIKEAKAENAKAAEMGHEWRDTGKFLKKAESEKDIGKALKLAKKALKQAKDAQVQAEKYKNAGPRF